MDGKDVEVELDDLEVYDWRNSEVAVKVSSGTQKKNKKKPTNVSTQAVNGFQGRGSSVPIQTQPEVQRTFQPQYQLGATNTNNEFNNYYGYQYQVQQSSSAYPYGSAQSQHFYNTQRYDYHQYQHQYQYPSSDNYSGYANQYPQSSQYSGYHVTQYPHPSQYSAYNQQNLTPSLYSGFNNYGNQDPASSNYAGYNPTPSYYSGYTNFETPEPEPERSDSDGENLDDIEVIDYSEMVSSLNENEVSSNPVNQDEQNGWDVEESGPVPKASTSVSYSPSIQVSVPKPKLPLSKVLKDPKIVKSPSKINTPKKNGVTKTVRKRTYADIEEEDDLCASLQRTKYRVSSRSYASKPSSKNDEKEAKPKVLTSEECAMNQSVTSSNEYESEAASETGISSPEKICNSACRLMTDITPSSSKSEMDIDEQDENDIAPYQIRIRTDIFEDDDDDNEIVSGELEDNSSKG